MKNYTARMDHSAPRANVNILAVDIGASSIKVGLFLNGKEVAEEVRKISTPYPCTPARLIDVITEEILANDCPRIGVGFPGDLDGGVVREPGNLSRPGGVTTEIDPTLHAEWVGMNLETALRRSSGHDVRVVNDATLAALGCSNGRGRELVFTLGTGFGIALVAHGEIVRIRDVGAEQFLYGATYDQHFGDVSRRQDEREWNQTLRDAVINFVQEFEADTVHFSGGNSRQVDVNQYESLAVRVVVNDNDTSLRGAVRLFEPEMNGGAPATLPADAEYLRNDGVT